MMGRRNVLQFRIRTLLIAITVLAAVLWGILQYVRPLIADVSLKGWSVVIHLTPAAGEDFAPDAYNFGPGSSPQNSDSSFTFLHDAYISIALSSIAMLFATLAAVLAGAYVIVRMATRWLTTGK